MKSIDSTPAGQFVSDDLPLALANPLGDDSHGGAGDEVRGGTLLAARRSVTAREGSGTPREPQRLSRRRFLRRGLGLTGLSAAGLAGTAGYATAIEPERLVTTRYRLALPGWRAGPLTIGVIADLHAGGLNMTLEHVVRAVDRTNELAPDLIVLLGDYFAHHNFVTERVSYAAWGSEFARLKAPLGVWAILGNHDWWFDLEGVRVTLAEIGIPLLQNRAVRLGEGSRGFWLAGLGDQIAHVMGRGKFSGEDDLAGTLAQVTTDDPVLLLAHEPDVFPRVPDRVALTLCGHTHGGQIRIPLIWPALMPAHYGRRLAYGHLVDGGRQMIVSGGLGTSIVPMRLGVPPEIVHIAIG
jgi:predicted MPP superfamily phosphohydrolase